MRWAGGGQAPARSQRIQVWSAARWSVWGRSDSVRQDFEAALRALAPADARHGRESAQAEAVEVLAREGLARLDALR